MHSTGATRSALGAAADDSASVQRRREVRAPDIEPLAPAGAGDVRAARRVGRRSSPVGTRCRRSSARRVADAGQRAQLAERHVEAMLRGADELGECMRQRFGLIVDLGGVERIPEDAQQWRSSAAASRSGVVHRRDGADGGDHRSVRTDANDHLTRRADAPPTSRPRAATIVSLSGNAHGLAISRQSCVVVVTSTKP
jgi:hypothetical protein